MKDKFSASKLLSFALALCMLYLIWQGGALCFGPDIIPSPKDTIGLFLASLSDEVFLNHLYQSFKRLMLSMIVASMVAYPLGLLLGLNNKADRLGSALLYLTYPLPKIVLLPVFFLLLGLGDSSRVCLIALTGGYQIVMIVRSRALKMNKVYALSLSFMGASFYQRLFNVYIKGTLPSFLTALRVASGTMVAVLFLAESFATDCGLGYLIMDAWGIGDTALMFAAMLAISLLGAFFYAAIYIAERLLCPWITAQSTLSHKNKSN